MNTNPSALRPNRRRRLPGNGGPARPAHWFSFVGAGALDRGRLYRSGQLGDRARRRRGLRLPAARHRAAGEPDGDAAAMAVVAPGRRDRARSRADLPRAHEPPRHALPVADQRGRDHRVRRRRGGRQRRRVAIATRRVADGRRADVGGLHLRAARAPAERRPQARSGDRGADRLRRPVLRGRTGAGAARLARRAGRHRAEPRTAAQRGHGVARGGHRRRDGDAAQPVSALRARQAPCAGRQRRADQGRAARRQSGYLRRRFRLRSSSTRRC